MKRREYGSLPAYAAKQILGEMWCGQDIDPAAVYYWDGEYYPVRELAYDAERHEVTLPGGVVLPGGNAIHLYAPIEEEGEGC